MKKILSILKIIAILTIWLFIFPQELTAQVVVNEFQISPSSAQWIELFNKGGDADISGWIIDDSAVGSSSKFTIPSGTILVSGKCMSFENDNFNWNTATSDSVRLLSGSSVVEEYPYLASPGVNISIGRAIDGEGGLIILANQSRDKYNSSSLSCLAPTPTPSPTPIQTSSKAIYKINKPKDDASNELASVQIYVDGEYIHHEDDETLEFYSGHECYSGVNCSLGIHSISIRKIGYSNWGETNDFQAGMSLEVNPILNKQTTASPVPTPTKTSTPIPTKTPKPTPKPSPTPEVLGDSNQEASPDSELGETSSPEPSQVKTGSKKSAVILGAIFTGLGVFAMGIAGYAAYTKSKSSDS